MSKDLEIKLEGKTLPEQIDLIIRHNLIVMLEAQMNYWKQVAPHQNICDIQSSLETASNALRRQ